MNKLRRRILIVLASALGLLMVFLILAIAFVQTSPGQRYLEKTLNGLLIWDKGQVVITGISGKIPFNLELENISIKDSRGEWLSISNARLRWSLSKLLRGKIHIYELGAAKALLSELPTSESREKEKKQMDLEDLDIKWKWPFPALTAEHIYLTRVIISHPVLDTRTELNLEGKLFADESGVSLASLEINRLDEPASLASLKAELNKNPYRLDLDLSLFDPGILKDFIPLENWPSDTILTLSGSGPLKTWQGELNLDGRDSFNASLNLEIVQDDLYLLRSRGDISINPDMLPARGLDFTRHPFELLIEAGLDNSGRMALKNLNIESPSLVLRSEALFDPRQSTVSGSFNLDFPDLNLLFMDSGFKSPDALSIDTNFDGPVDELSAQTRISLGAVSGNGLSLNQAGLTADFMLNPSSAAFYAAKGDIDFSGFNIQSYTNLPPDLAFEFDLRHTRENALELNRLKLNARDLEADLAGQMDFNSLKFSGNLNTYAKDVQQLIPGLTRDSFFAADMHASIQGGGDIRGFSYHTSTDIVFPRFDADNPYLQALVGDKADLKADLAFDRSLTLNVSRANLEAAEFDFNGSGHMDFKNMLMDYTGDLAVDSLKNLGEKKDMAMSGSLETVLSAAGKIAGPDVSAVIQARDFTYNHLEPADITAEIKSEFAHGLPRGSLQASAIQADRRLDLASDFSLKTGHLEISEFISRAPGFQISADLDLDLKEILARGNIQADISDLSYIGDFLDKDLTGTLESEINLTSTRDEQNISFSLNGEDLAHESITLSGIKASGQVEHLFTRAAFQSETLISGITAARTEIDHVAINMAGTRDKIDYQTVLSGQVVHPLDLSLTGSLAMSKPEFHLELTDIHGAFAQEDFELKSPLTLIHSPEQSLLEPFSLVFGSGRVSGEGHLTSEEVNAFMDLKDLQITDLPIKHLDHILGVVDLNLRLSGSPENPVLQADLDIDELSPGASHLEIPRTLSLNARGYLDSGQATMEASLGDKQTDLADLNFWLPLDFSLKPLALAYSDPVPLSGEIKSRLELKTLAGLFLPPDQLLSGHFSSDFLVSGTLEKPLFQGTAEVTQASYEHLEAGLYITDLDVNAKGEQTRIVISEINGSDGSKGRVQGSGFIDLDPSGDIPFDLRININDMRLMEHKTAIVRVNSADLEASGNKSGAEISGRVLFDSVEASLPEQTPPEVVDLDVTEINNGRDHGDTEKTSSGFDYPADLDIELDFPARVYVRGRGLDSEWKGKLHVSGRAAEPSARGSLNIVRGHLDFLDRRFNLNNESYINLDGSAPPDPYMDIKADYGRKDMVINVRVYGPALEPEVELSSNPPMPQDEILAWVLFGRDLSSISPFQAYTLINAARNLTLGETGPDMMGRLRDFIGVDDITVSVDPDQDGTQFGLGKYVNEKVYLEVKTGTEPGSNSVSVEVELTPRISLESSVESDSDSGIGVFWKYDY
ncbi:MAG: translocation/assembly module TamB domain-containing protein [Desulfonatronovibrio sp.]